MSTVLSNVRPLGRHPRSQPTSHLCPTLRLRRCFAHALFSEALELTSAETVYLTAVSPARATVTGEICYLPMSCPLKGGFFSTGAWTNLHVRTSSQGECALMERAACTSVCVPPGAPQLWPARVRVGLTEYSGLHNLIWTFLAVLRGCTSPLFNDGLI